jgi:hypothetical protein
MGYQFGNLLFEGGNVKGIAYVGAMEELRSRDILPQIKRVGGTSDEKKLALVDSGRQGVKKYLEWFDQNDTVNKP